MMPTLRIDANTLVEILDLPQPVEVLGAAYDKETNLLEIEVHGMGLAHIRQRAVFVVTIDKGQQKERGSLVWFEIVSTT